MTGTAGVLAAAGIAAAVLLIVLLFWIHRRSRLRGEAMDEMEGHDFEFFCADLLRGAGFENVEVTRGSGDFGADILCERDGVTYAIQCKCYDSIVGVHAVQEAYAGKAFYGRMVAAVMTNRFFTEPARTCADRLRVLLWDREYIERLMDAANRQ